jgi:putative ABC transport system substrate-binding protein
MVGVADPVGLGLVASLARPGGNVTGVSRDTGPEIIGKRLQLLKEAVPKASRVGVLTTKTHWRYSGRHNEAAARALGMAVVYAEVDKPEQYTEVFAAITRERADALLAAEGSLNFVHRRRIVDFTATSRLPAMFAFRESVEAGGRMAFGVETMDLYQRAAVYVDKILKGAKPADLPIEQPSKFELVINRASRES